MKHAPHLRAEQTPKQRAKAAAAMGRRRWADVSPAERRQIMTQLATLSSRRTPGKLRCPCGQMTLLRAQQRADENGKSLGHLKDCVFWKAPAGPPRPRKGKHAAV